MHQNWRLVPRASWQGAAAMSDPHILAIDLGTSSLKLALVSVKGEVAGFTTRALPISYLPGGGCEQDTNDWWTAICAATRELVDTKVVPVDDVIGISCTTTWSARSRWAPMISR